MSTRTTRQFVLYSLLPGVAITAVTASLAIFANAQVSSSSGNVSETASGLAEEASSTIAPLSNSFLPGTPWPALLDISQTVLAPQHDLLSYAGVETQAKHLLGDEYEQWASHFGGKSQPKPLESGLLMANGCLAPNCSLHKSLLIVSPVNQKVYAAMVTKGKVAMWPSLMSWPDDAIPTLKTWLAAATDDDDTSPTTTSDEK